MIKIGITGSIGSGKSEVCRILREHSYPVLDADEIARQLTERDPEVRAQLRRRFGAQCFDERGKLKRKELARLVFSDPNALKDLNRIVHPPMIDSIREELDRLVREGHPCAFVEAAVLFEAQMEPLFDAVVVVASELSNAIRRTAKRLGITEAQAWQRYRAQIPIEEKIQRADYVIRNDSTLEDLAIEVQKFLKWLETKFPNWNGKSVYG